MRRVSAIALALVTVLVVAAPAGAASGPTLKSLQAEVTVLKKQVKTLQTKEKQDHTLALGAYVYTGCAVATIADALQGTWMTVDSYVTGAGHAALFGPQTAVDDLTTCQAWSIVRAKTPVPPAVSVLQAVLNLLK
ncbi:MAG: hypothetical protein WBB76_01970 [Gaiellaceae bacterium]